MVRSVHYCYPVQISGLCDRNGTSLNYTTVEQVRKPFSACTAVQCTNTKPYCRRLISTVVHITKTDTLTYLLTYWPPAWSCHVTEMYMNIHEAQCYESFCVEAETCSWESEGVGLKFGAYFFLTCIKCLNFGDALSVGLFVRPSLRAGVVKMWEFLLWYCAFWYILDYILTKYMIKFFVIILGSLTRKITPN